MTDEVIPMALTCARCGKRIHNDDSTIRHPSDFLQACRTRGWFCDEGKQPLCPTDSGKG